MNKKNRLFAVFFMALLLTCGFSGWVFAAYGNSSGQIVLKIGNKIYTNKTCQIRTGDRVSLTAESGTDVRKMNVKYVSSNKKIVSVTSAGMMKAKKKGTAKIKVTVLSGNIRNTAWMKVKVVNKKSAPAFNFHKKTVRLNSGYDMPLNGIGTYSLSGSTCVDSVTEALKRGVRLIDTAYFYDNEREVGKAVKNSGVPREDLFVTTKLYPDQYDDPEKAINEALEKLDAEYIDLMLLHHPGTNDVKAYKALEKAVKQGKIRSIGLSNWYIEELQEFLPQVTITPAVVQNEIHPYYQESNVIDYIQSLGIVVEGWFPFGGRGHTKELLSDAVISRIAAAHGRSSAQVILRWNLQNGVVVIPGSSNPAHIQENTELYNFELTQEEMNQIRVLNRDEKHEWY